MFQVCTLQPHTARQQKKRLLPFASTSRTAAAASTMHCRLLCSMTYMLYILMIQINFGAGDCFKLICFAASSLCCSLTAHRTALQVDLSLKSEEDPGPELADLMLSLSRISKLSASMHLPCSMRLMHTPYVLPVCYLLQCSITTVTLLCKALLVPLPPTCLTLILKSLIRNALSFADL